MRHTLRAGSRIRRVWDDAYGGAEVVEMLRAAGLEDDSDRFFDWGGWAPLAGAAEGQREGEAMPSGT